MTGSFSMTTDQVASQKDISVRRFFLPALLAAFASTAAAQSLPLIVEGNWQPPDSANQFRAELTEEGDFARLRIYDQGATEPVLDVAEFVQVMAIAPDSVTWLESVPGGLRIISDSPTNAHPFREEIILQRAGGKIIIARSFTNWVEEPFTDEYGVDYVPAQPGALRTCTVDFLDGTVDWSGEMQPLPDLSADDTLAKNWGYGRVYSLGLCKPYADAQPAP